MTDEIRKLTIEVPVGLRQLPEEIATRILKTMVGDGSTAVPHFEFIKEFVDRQDAEECSSTYFRAAIYSINFFSVEDPSNLHYQAARDVLREAGGTELEENEKARDLLARELVKECREVASKIIPDNLLQENVADKVLFSATSPDDKAEYLTYGVDAKLWLDDLFIKFISKIGSRGEEISKDINSASNRWYQEYLETKNAKKLFRLWVDPDKAPYYCRYLQLLADALWCDRVRTQVSRTTRQTPALPQGVLLTTIKPPLSKGSKVEVINNSIACFSESGREIATVPCADPRLVPLICKGMQGLSSLTGHKLLRWQVRTGFNNWASGLEDPRLICTTGGYEGVAELVGCGNSKKSPTEVKAILYAQAHGLFQFPNGGSGNMIILREMEKLRNGEPCKINIILGEMLLPNFAQGLPKGEARRLVPITELPPLIGSKNTHAAQAMLQLLILEIFSKQSDVLVRNNCIEITIERWTELAIEAGLPISILRRVIEGWINGDLFTKPFLERQGEEYTLGPSYAPVLKFLEYQGQQRIDGARGGEKSANQKKALAEGKYQRRKKPKS